MTKPRGRYKGIDISNALDPLGDTGTSSLPTPQGKWSSINKAKACSTPGALNETEKARARTLETMRLGGEIRGWLPQAMIFQLGARCTYRPDFIVQELDDTVTFEEVKGERGWKLDPKGRIKWKWAGERFPLFLFRGVIQKEGGWKHEEYKPRAEWPPMKGGPV